MRKSIIDDPEVMELFEKDPLPDKKTFARMIAQAGVDPLPLRELGEPFDFKAKPKWRVFEHCDFTYLNAEVPLPNADVNLFEALEEFEKDFECIQWVNDETKRDRKSVTLEGKHRILMLLWDWWKFLAYRHPDPGFRDVFRNLADEASAMSLVLRKKIMARITAQRAEEGKQ
jgi:hypothetical protein